MPSRNRSEGFSKGAPEPESLRSITLLECHKVFDAIKARRPLWWKRDDKKRGYTPEERAVYLISWLYDTYSAREYLVGKGYLAEGEALYDPLTHVVQFAVGELLRSGRQRDAELLIRGAGLALPPPIEWMAKVKGLADQGPLEGGLLTEEDGLRGLREAFKPVRDQPKPRDVPGFERVDESGLAEEVDRVAEEVKAQSEDADEFF